MANVVVIIQWHNNVHNAQCKKKVRVLWMVVYYSKHTQCVLMYLNNIFVCSYIKNCILQAWEGRASCKKKKNCKNTHRPTAQTTGQGLWPQTVSTVRLSIVMTATTICSYKLACSCFKMDAENLITWCMMV